MMPTKGLEPGTVVDVRGDDGQDFGSGFFNPKSLIAVRLFGRESGLAADAKFFTARLTRALAFAAGSIRAPSIGWSMPKATDFPAW